MKRYVSLLALLWISSGLVGLNSTIASDEIAAIKEAVQRRICYDIYWLGDTYQLGASLSFQINIEGEKFLAWADNMKVITGEYHVAAFFTGRVKNAKGAVILREAYNSDSNPPIPGYLENKRHFEVGPVIRTTLTLPKDCTPCYDPSTPKKELMLRTVVSTMQKQLSGFVKKNIAKYPREVALIIANFNIDYPYTYILVEPMEEVYIVTLHDPQDYDSEEYEQNGEYPFGEIYSKPKSLLAKIRKHGIVRKIVVAPY